MQTAALESKLRCCHGSADKDKEKNSACRAAASASRAIVAWADRKMTPAGGAFYGALEGADMIFDSGFLLSHRGTKSAWT